MRDRIKAFFMTPVYLWRSLKMKSPGIITTAKILLGSILLVVFVTVILIIMANAT